MPLVSFDNTEKAFQYRSNKELKKAQFLFSTMAYPNVAQIGMSLAKWIVKWNLPFIGMVKSILFRQFCGGENLKEIAETTERLIPFGISFCLDYGVEGATGEAAFDEAVLAFEETIIFAAAHANIPFIPMKITGFADSELLEKASTDMASLTEAETAAWQRVYDRIARICKMAVDHDLNILIDAEESWMQQAVDDLADKMMSLHNKEKAYIFNTYQMYRHDRLAFIKDSLKTAQENNYKLGVKIVRGAYMEKERERATLKGYLSPIQIDKEATDRDYNLAIDYCFEHLSDLELFIGTHNEFSSLKGAEQLAAKGYAPNDARVSFSQLFGMSDNITFNLAAAGYNASKYLPYGPIKDVIPYLIRRANENTSVAGQTSRELFLINKEIARRKKG